LNEQERDKPLGLLSSKRETQTLDISIFESMPGNGKITFLGSSTTIGGSRSMIKRRPSSITKIINRGPPHSKTFNWATIPTPQCDLVGLSEPFTEEEVKAAVDNTASDKAPGPDGFSGAFFKACWNTIKADVMSVIHQFSNLQTSNLHWLNSANIALIPKKDGAGEVMDFHPISLIHAIAKLISKMMASRLAPHMNKLVSNAQSALIKKRSIHDNFLYVRNLARKMHKSKTPSLLFKLDIKKAFDSVRSDYLMELLQHLGFPIKFRDWIAALLSSSSSRVLLNGITSDPIKHGRGLRQGDPLSPLLFVLAIDPLHHILHKPPRKGTSKSSAEESQ
jgi:hypothetical protein